MDIWVAPPAGAWIETSYFFGILWYVSVAPPAGAWIETGKGKEKLAAVRVAPPAGAWIETMTRPCCLTAIRSLPPRERGLKLAVPGAQIRRSGRSPRGSVD